MGLRVNIELDNGISLSAGYLRIRYVSRQRPIDGPEVVEIIYDIYKDEDHRRNKKQPVFPGNARISSLIGETPNPYFAPFLFSAPGYVGAEKAAYTYLKTAEKFSKAQDVLEDSQ